MCTVFSPSWWRMSFMILTMAAAGCQSVAFRPSGIGCDGVSGVGNRVPVLICDGSAETFSDTLKFKEATNGEWFPSFQDCMEGMVDSGVVLGTSNSVTADWDGLGYEAEAEWVLTLNRPIVDCIDLAYSKGMTIDVYGLLEGKDLDRMTASSNASWFAFSGGNNTLTPKGVRLELSDKNVLSRRNDVRLLVWRVRRGQRHLWHQTSLSDAARVAGGDVLGFVDCVARNLEKDAKTPERSAVSNTLKKVEYLALSAQGSGSGYVNDKSRVLRAGLYAGLFSRASHPLRSRVRAGLARQIAAEGKSARPGDSFEMELFVGSKRVSHTALEIRGNGERPPPKSPWLKIPFFTTRGKRK
jgi:hypothetical protein